MNQDLCRIQSVDEERVARARAMLRDQQTITTMADLFKVLGEATRVRILLALFEEELCVCEIAAALAMSSSAVSHQLRILRTARLVRVRREGKMAFYALDDQHVRHLFAEVLEHLQE